jgi:flavodoxin
MYMAPTMGRSDIGSPDVANAEWKESTGSPRALIVLSSYHHKNTEKVARAMAATIDADISSPQEMRIEDLERYDLIGFGSGIYDAKHHLAILDLADRLPMVNGKMAFIFSTSAIMGERKVAGDHSALREKLSGKGYRIVDEFACKGYNTNSFLKYLGGMNKGHPDAEDLAAAGRFARRLRRDDSA